jgi:hypothetical protein
MSWAAVAAAGVGAGVGLLGGSKGGSTTTVQNNDPWSGVQPHLLNVFGGGQQLYGQGPYRGPFISPQSPYSQSAISGQAASAQDPNSLIGQSQRQLGSTIAGDYLSVDKNPAIQSAIDAARRTVSSQFSGDNYGGSAHQEWLTRGATSAALPYLAQERQNQLNAMQLAPGLQQAGFSQLAGAGAAQEGRGQAEIAAAQQQQQAPWQNLFNYQLALGSGQGYGTQTMQQPYFTNPLASAMGGAVGGLGFYNAFQRPPQQQQDGYGGGGFGSGAFDIYGGGGFGLT